MVRADLSQIDMEIRTGLALYNPTSDELGAEETTPFKSFAVAVEQQRNACRISREAF